MTLIDDFISKCQNRTENLIVHYLKKGPSQKLIDAMRYSTMNGGKRLRPLLVYATGKTLDAPWENCDIAAAAIELIHTYSLIHDDLPAMDNADLRRGKPSCHKAFNEAFAILAGDALQTIAFEIIASHPANLKDKQRLLMIQVLSKASGFEGMAAGQAIDIEGFQHNLDTLTHMYALKTGALIKACIQMGIIAAGSQDQRANTALEKYAELLGLAFQLQDDLLDVEGITSITGKQQGLDSENKKITYASLCGVEATHRKIREIIAQALNTIEFLGKNANILHDLSHYVLERKK